MADQVPFAGIPMPQREWSFQWGKQLVVELRTLFARPMRLQRFTVAGVPSASGVGDGVMIYVTNEVGGAVPAFSDGTNWRRVTDRAIIS